MQKKIVEVGGNPPVMGGNGAIILCATLGKMGNVRLLDKLRVA